MSWAAIAAKNKDVPRPESQPQVVQSKALITEETEAEQPETAELVEAVKKMELVQNSPDRKVLVLDTGGLIKGSTGLAEMADEFVTIQDVMTEVRDKKTRDFVESFPFAINIREPTKEAMREVIRVAKITGDFGTLSSVDLRVLGMAYTVAEEMKSLSAPPTLAVAGTARQKPKVNMAPRGTVKSANVPSLPGWGEWQTNEEQIDDKKPEQAGEEKPEEEEEEEGGEEKEQILKADGEGEEVKEEAEEVEGGWITKENIKDYSGCTNKFGSDSTDDRNVGCMTTDFAMQNVLMHAGVQVVSVEGYRVKHLKKWVLRCHGCFTIVKDTTRQFCPDCGSGDTLKRVSYSINENGEEEIWINPRRKIGVRGTIFNIPKPRGGRAGTNKTYVIREDQLLNCGRKYNLDEKREDYVASLLSDDWMFAADSRDKKKPQHVRASKSSYSSKNPNKGRKRKV